MKFRSKLGGLLIVLSFFFLLLGINFEYSITGNVFSNYFQGNYILEHIFGLIFLVTGLGLFVQGKSLEAIMVPTGPTDYAVIQRAKEGFKQYDADPSRLVIISGQYKDKAHSDKFLGSKSDKIYRKMRKEGIPKNHFIIENESYNTQQNIIKTFEKLKDEDLKGIIIVTDKHQGKRFQMMFRKAKNKGIIPEDLEIKIDSQGIDNSYGPIRSGLVYLKDYLTFGITLDKYSKKH